MKSTMSAVPHLACGSRSIRPTAILCAAVGVTRLLPWTYHTAILFSLDTAMPLSGDKSIRLLMHG